MWIDSRTAAAVLGVNLRTLQRKAINAQNKCQKILTIDTQKIMYQFIFSSRGGSSGKVLQIWLDDELIIDAINRGIITDPMIKAKLLSMLNMRDISCNDTPISDSSLRDIKESRAKNEYNDTKSNFNSDGGCCNAALDRDFKNYSDMDNAPNVNNFKNGTHCRLKDIKNSDLYIDIGVSSKEEAEQKLKQMGE